MIGLAGLLKLLEVVSRLQAAQQGCTCAPQEAGVPCLTSPPDQTIWPALPPPTRAPMQPRHSRWQQLPPANRRRLLQLLSHLVERQLRSAVTTLPASRDREEVEHDLPH
jgi:hypothetical protein